MKLTSENEIYIDSLSYETLLSLWRHSPVQVGGCADKWFSGETAMYWGLRMEEFKNNNPEEAVRISKTIGW